MPRVPFLIVSIDYTEDPTFLTHLRVKGLDGQNHVLTVENCVPRFWTEKNPSSIPNLPPLVKSWKPSGLRSVTGAELFEVRVENLSDRREMKEFFYPHYSADVAWRSLVRWIYDWTAVIDVDEAALKGPNNLRPLHITPSETDYSEFTLDVLWFDIETEDSLDMKTSPKRVVSIAILDSVTGIHEIGTTCPTSERQVQRFLASQEALESIVEHTAPIPPIPTDKVVVKSFSFDDPDTNEAALLWWFKERVEALDRDLLGGQNILGYDIPYLKNRSRRMRREMSRRYYDSVPVFHRFPNLDSITRRPLFDSKRAYAEQVRGELTSGSLVWMSERVLGYGKVPRTRITELMVRDPMLLAIYNAWDNVCVARCMDELNLVPFYLAKAAFNNSLIQNIHSNMMLIEDTMGHLLMRHSMVMPSLDVVRDRMEEAEVEGGFVMENPSGVFLNAFELDNATEYPAQIINGNLCPSTIVSKDDYPNGFPFPVTSTPSGRYYRRDRDGIIPGVLRSLTAQRRQTQREMRKALADGDDEMAHILDMKQRVMKESSNSFYGVMASGSTEKTRGRPFRLVNPGIASDITEGARLHNEWNRKKIESTILLFSAEGIEPNVPQNTPDLAGAHARLDGFPLEFRVIGQDTDSCKVFISNQPEAEEAIRPFTESDITSSANLLCLILNGTYDEFVQTTYGIERNEMLMVKPDAYYERYFAWGVKKRYAYREFNGKDGFRGVEIRRSSVPQVVKTAQHRVFKSILNGCDKRELNEILRDIHDTILDVEKTPNIHFGQPFGIKTAGTQAHKAAMWSNDHLDTDFDIGDKPTLYVAKSASTSLPSNRVVAIVFGEDPSSFGIMVDREKSFAKHFTNSQSWSGILGAFNTSWESALAGMSQSSLVEWFA